MSKINLKKGDTIQFKKDDEVIQLYFQNGRYFIEHKRPLFPNGLVSYNTLKEAKADYNRRVAHLKTRLTFVSQPFEILMKAGQ